MRLNGAEAGEASRLEGADVLGDSRKGNSHHL